MKPLTLLALGVLTSFVSASPLIPSATRPLKARQGSGTAAAPCAQVSEYMYGDGTTVVKSEVPAGLAMECLSSVPFNATSAKKLIAALRPYMNWQSTLDTLANPPAEYVEKVQPPIDIISGLDQIDVDIDSNRFENEYDFGWTLYTLIQSAHDGHFNYIPDSVASIFTWGRPVPLVSVSADGIKLPAVFAYIDVIGQQFKNITYTPSPVVEIDGMDAKEWLEDLSQYGGLQDRDALYNNLFFELAQISLGQSGSVTGAFTGGGRGRYIYPGDTTTLKFANGSEYTMQNYARVVINFRNVTDGEALGDKWFRWGPSNGAGIEAIDRTQKQGHSKFVSAEAASGPRPGPGPASSDVPGYPVPVVSGPVNLINGFFIDAPGYEDVAVLALPNFVGSSMYSTYFQRTTQEFIPKALAAGKTKLILDVQANGGGTILQGYDLFKQLFPDEDPYGANRFRAHEAVDLIGKAYSAVASRAPRTAKPSNYTVQAAQTSWFDYHSDMTVDGEPFSSWEEKYGPVEVNGAQYTTLNRWNLSDVYIPNWSGGINVTGHNSLANVTGPPKFKPENIVILTDGYCASTCTIFAEFLTQQVGVKTIAMGGRSNKDPIQAIGGTKGVNNYGFSYIQQSAQSAVRYDSLLNNSTLKQDYYSDYPALRASSAGVNNRDGLRQDDDSGVALQFKYEEADCRLYYTPEMTVDITALWKAAADAQWKDSGKCVHDSGYGQKREVHGTTTRLDRRRVQMAPAAMVRQAAALEESFSLETDCQLTGDGFMEP